jgi:prepilin-type N-terminal cleavage/methylation domain-containing protein
MNQLKSPQSFTLIEVMLAVAIFALAAVGFAVALNDVFGIQTQLIKTSQVRQAVESCAARILATTNNLTPTGERFVEDPLFSTERFRVEISANPLVPPIQIPTADGRGTRQFAGWWQIRVRAIGADQQQADGVSMLLWPR